MTDPNQRPLAVRLLFVAVAVVCFGQAYRIAAAVGGRAEAASVAQTSTVSAPSLPRYVEKPIEEIRAGDLVLARNEVTGELASKRVVRTFQRTSDHIRELTIRSSLGGLQTIETTDEHPFWVTDSGWVSAAQLSPGAALLDSEGGTATVVANAHIPRSDGVPVYNFEVDDWHTYHVKAGHATGPPLLVHNNCVNPYHARAPGGGVFVDLDTSLAGRGGAPTSVRPSLNTSLPGRVTGELAPGQVRTAAENAQARNFFKHNRDSARQWWEERTGRQWPSDATHYEHPRPLADGGDPLFVEPGFGGPNAPHMIPGPDGLTDFQRWGSRGGRPRSN